MESSPTSRKSGLSSGMERTGTSTCRSSRRCTEDPIVEVETQKVVDDIEGFLHSVINEI
jgi:hypothetical protein